MGILDTIGQAVGAMTGGGSNQNPLLQAAIQMLSQQGANSGLAGLVQDFQKNGLGEIVNSWVSTGQNLPISAQQIQQGLGGDLLTQLAGKAGLSPEAASGQLAGLLPGLVDKLTPNGTLPDATMLEQGLGLLRGKLA
ncbi:MAG: DUF937 domain-containing protein [Nitrospira sp.]|nr:MAG: DUF937 domain-containing protein [Nitrospira sp.]